MIGASQRQLVTLQENSPALPKKRSGGHAETSALSGAQRMKLYKMNGY